MFATLSRPRVVVKIKKRERDLSVFFGRWTQSAAHKIRNAALSGEITIYVWSKFSDRSSRMEPAVVPVDVVRLLIPIRCGLPDHAYRIHTSLLRRDGMTPQLFAALRNGTLCLNSPEFQAWYQTEYGKRKWPSQRKSEKPRIGRPPLDKGITDAIESVVNSGRWTVRQPITRLRRILLEDGVANVPSEETIKRRLDELHLRTGDPLMYKPAQRNRKVTQKSLPSDKNQPD